MSGPTATHPGFPKRDNAGLSVPLSTAIELPDTDLRVTLQCNIALRGRRRQGAGRLKVSVSLVDTPVEIEKGFSHSESTTSQKLSRYTFDMFGKEIFS
jgi:hypothetical protein